MEHLPNGYTLELSAGTFPLSTDSMALAHFAKLPPRAQVLDLGSGCGTLGLLLCAKDGSCRVTGIELDAHAHITATENIHRNQLAARMESICADLRQLSTLISPGSYTCCVSNPPYFSGGPASQSLPSARREDQCTLEDIMAAASWALKYGGDFFLVHRPERLGEIIAKAAAHKLEAKRLCLVRHREGAPVNLVLIHLRKGAKPGLIWEELALHHTDGTYTEAYKAIYHI